MANQALIKKGEDTRARLFGADFNSQAAAAAASGGAEFSEAFEELTMEAVWGNVWSREQLPMKTRSLLALAFLTALHRPDQVKIHVKGALNSGNSREEISEVFLQSAIYAGFPAAAASYKAAREVFAELDKKA